MPCPGASSSSLPETLAMDHSSPSGLLDANQETRPPVRRAATKRPIKTVLYLLALEGRAVAIWPTISGSAMRTKLITAEDFGDVDTI